MSTHSLRNRWNRFDRQLVRFMAHYGIRFIRISLAIIFIWFGMLKAMGKSPVIELVSKTVYWFDPKTFIPILGLWEMVVGLGLLFRFALRVTLFLFWLQLAGTFLVLVIRPDIAFQGGNPFLLTTEGEFVVKNLVLISAGLIIGSTVYNSEKRLSS